MQELERELVYNLERYAEYSFYVAQEEEILARAGKIRQILDQIGE